VGEGVACGGGLRGIEAGRFAGPSCEDVSRHQLELGEYGGNSGIGWEVRWVVWQPRPCKDSNPLRDWGIKKMFIPPELGVRECHGGVVGGVLATGQGPDHALDNIAQGTMGGKDILFRRTDSCICYAMRPEGGFGEVWSVPRLITVKSN